MRPCYVSSKPKHVFHHIHILYIENIAQNGGKEDIHLINVYNAINLTEQCSTIYLAWGLM
jgi:hypothetical protein